MIALGPAVPDLPAQPDRRAGRRAREPRARARARRATTSCTASSPACRASPTWRCATRVPSRSRPSSRPSGSATRPARRSASGCSGGSTRLSRPPRRWPRRRPSDCPATTGCHRRRRPRAASGPAASGGSSCSSGGRASGALARAVVRALADAGRVGARLAADEAARRPAVRCRGALRGRARVRTLRDGAARAPLLSEASIFVPAFEGLDRVSLEASAAGAAIVSPPGLREQPELAAAELLRLAEDDGLPRARRRAGPRGRRAAELRRRRARSSTSSTAAWRPGDAQGAPRRATRRPRLDRRRPPPAHLLVARLPDPGRGPARPRRGERASARSPSPTTTSSAAPSRRVEQARGRDLVVIPGEEVKTDDQGEVIGLFLSEEIPRGLSFGETVAAIRAQGGIVYLPHPFDRMHAIPEPGHAASPPRARSTCSRSTTRASSSRPTTTRRCASRASTT